MIKTKQVLIFVIIALPLTSGASTQPEQTPGRISHPPYSLFTSEPLRYNSRADSHFF